MTDGFVRIIAIIIVALITWGGAYLIIKKKVGQ